MSKTVLLALPGHEPAFVNVERKNFNLEVRKLIGRHADDARVPQLTLCLSTLCDTRLRIMFEDPRGSDKGYNDWATRCIKSIPAINVNITDDSDDIHGPAVVYNIEKKKSIGRRGLNHIDELIQAHFEKKPAL